MKNSVFDMADLYAGVLCCWSILKQRLEPIEDEKSIDAIMSREKNLKKYSVYFWSPSYLVEAVNSKTLCA